MDMLVNLRVTPSNTIAGIHFYYIDKSVLLGTKPLVDSIRHFILDPSGVFSSLSLKLYLNYLVYHRNIFGSSSKVFGNLWESSDIFGHLRKFRKFLENVRKRSSGLRNNFGKSSEGGRKSSENHQKRRLQHVCIIKRTLHGGLKI